MIFYSNNFTFNDISSKDINIHLVSEDSGILNDYGIPFNIENDTNEVTLSFCYAQNGSPIEWTYEATVDFLSWIITEDYCEFISEDNEDIIYFLKGVGYKKRFANNMTGIIDVTFQVLTPYGYKHYIREVSSGERRFEIYNFSNIDNAYKPVIVLRDITTNYIRLTNTTTNKEPFLIENLTKGEVIYIDNERGIIMDSSNENRLNNSNRSWVELCKGANIFSVEGTCNVRIEAYYPMLV